MVGVTLDLPALVDATLNGEFTEYGGPVQCLMSAGHQRLARRQKRSTNDLGGLTLMGPPLQPPPSADP